MGLFGFGKKRRSVQPAPEPRADRIILDEPGEPRSETFPVAGLSYRFDAVESVGKRNPHFDRPASELIAEGRTDKPIYAYSFFHPKFTLEPELSNQSDPYAVKVLVDGVHIGYIPADNSRQICMLLRAGRVMETKGFIRGGSRKVYTPADRDFLVVDEHYKAKVTIEYI